MVHVAMHIRNACMGNYAAMGNIMHGRVNSARNSGQEQILYYSSVAIAIQFCN